MGALGENEGGSESESGVMSGPIEGSDLVLSSVSTTSCSTRKVLETGDLSAEEARSHLLRKHPRTGRGW